MLQGTENYFIQAQILQLLMNREGLYYRIEDDKVEERLERILMKAGSLQIW